MQAWRAAGMLLHSGGAAPAPSHGALNTSHAGCCDRPPGRARGGCGPGAPCALCSRINQLQWDMNEHGTKWHQCMKGPAGKHQVAAEATRLQKALPGGQGRAGASGNTLLWWQPWGKCATHGSCVSLFVDVAERDFGDSDSQLVPAFT